MASVLFQDAAAAARTRRAARVVLSLYCLLVAAVVLWPVHVDANAGGESLRLLLETGHAVGWLPAWFGYNQVEWLSNVVMFVPLGLLLTLLLPARRRFGAVAISVLATCAIETVQLMLPGRTSSLWDIFANSLGGLLGWGLGILLIHCVAVRLRAKTSVK